MPLPHAHIFDLNMTRSCPSLSKKKRKDRAYETHHLTASRQECTQPQGGAVRGFKCREHKLGRKRCTFGTQLGFRMYSMSSTSLCYTLAFSLHLKPHKHDTCACQLNWHAHVSCLYTLSGTRVQSYVYHSRPCTVQTTKSGSYYRRTFCHDRADPAQDQPTHPYRNNRRRAGASKGVFQDACRGWHDEWDARN